MKKVFLKTFGCRTNIYDTEVMASNLGDYCRVFDEKDADIVIVNSCTVTNSADVRVRSYIRRMNSANKRVIIAGCGALSRGESLKEEGLVHGVIGHSQKTNIAKLLDKDSPFVQKGDLLSLDLPNALSGNKTKAFVKIQEGCDFQCSYCIIPSVRGKARSHKELDLLKQIDKLVNKGFSEIVLTGTNIGSYGKDTNSSLGHLLQKLGDIKGLKRVRLGSIEPVQIDGAVLEVLNESWIERHLHIALQHTSPKMLKLMRRRNSVEKDLKLFEDLASRGFALGTDFITGHPGESQEVWDEAWQWVRRFPLTHIHGFTYSKRNGTPSANMSKTVSSNIAKRRLKELKTLIFKNNLNFRYAHKDEILNVLIEESSGKKAFGYDQFYNPVHLYGKINRHSWAKLSRYTIKDKCNEATI